MGARKARGRRIHVHLVRRDTVCESHRERTVCKDGFGTSEESQRLLSPHELDKTRGATPR